MKNVRNHHSKTYYEGTFLAFSVPLVIFVVYVTILIVAFFGPGSKPQPVTLYVFLFLLAAFLPAFSLVCLRDSFILRVQRNAVVEWTGPHRVKTALADLHYAYFASCFSKEDGFPGSASWVNVKRKISGNYYVIFTSEPLEGYSFLPLHVLRDRYGKSFKAFAGYSSTAATRLLQEFQGKLYVPASVYKDNSEDLKGLLHGAELILLSDGQTPAPAEQPILAPKKGDNVPALKCYSLRFRLYNAIMGTLLLGGSIACFCFWGKQDLVLQVLSIFFLVFALGWYAAFAWSLSARIGVGEEGISLRTLLGEHSYPKTAIHEIRQERNGNPFFSPYFAFIEGGKRIPLGDNPEVASALEKKGYPLVK